MSAILVSALLLSGVRVHALSTGSATSPSRPTLAPRCRRSVAVASPPRSAVAQHSEDDSEPLTADIAAALPRPSSLLHVLWRFSRPHTMLGSAVCIPALTLYAAPAGALSLPLLQGVLYAMPAALLMNVYITGLNQLLDIEIDRINKPDLPLASGELSPLAGSLLVAGALIFSLGLGWWHPWLSTNALRITLLGSAVLGTLYSAPPFRLKRFPLLASACIITVRCMHARVPASPRPMDPLARALPARTHARPHAPCRPQRCAGQLGLLRTRDLRRRGRGRLAAVGGARLVVAAASLLGARWLLQPLRPRDRVVERRARHHGRPTVWNPLLLGASAPMVCHGLPLSRLPLSGSDGLLRQRWIAAECYRVLPSAMIATDGH